MRLSFLSACLLPILSIGCGIPASPTAPTAPTAAAPARVEPIALEAEAGSGEGDLMHRSRASGALTIHLAPGQRRRWTFNVAQSSTYAVLVTYANDNPGATEVLRVEVDGEAIGTFSAQDTVTTAKAGMCSWPISPVHGCSEPASTPSRWNHPAVTGASRSI